MIRSIESWRADLSRRSANDADEKPPGAYVGGIGFRKVQGIESTQYRYPPLERIHGDNLARRIETRSGSHVVVAKDIDPERKADEIYTQLVGRPVYEKMKADYGSIGRVANFVD